MDDTAQKLGLLIETAETTQQLAAALLERWRQQLQGLDTVVRGEIRRTLLEELREVHTESQRAADSLRDIQRSATRRTAFWSVGLTLLSSALSLAVAAWWLPSPQQIARLTTERADLLANLALLQQHGASANLRPCGDRRLCVRVDLTAPRYGDASDYLVLHGY
jgi:hypothetical protein